MKLQNVKNSIVNNLPISESNRKILERRINKLIKDPKGFVKGSYNKRSAQVVSKTPIKHRGSNDFTVISAVYNVEKYLDDYFKSLVNQSLSFKRHLYLIVVDDGSTDSSAKIIKKWQAKFPNNIRYVYKENGGQASARNLGMQYVDTDWITFIDPDDFVNSQYFKVIDDTLINNKDVYAVGCSLELYLENGRIIKNTHPLKYKFSSKNRKHSISDLDKNIQMSASSTIFKVNESITKGYCHFNEKIRPNFEDAKFIADYFLYNYDKKIIFVENAKYYYRKREDGSSTLDNSWKKIELFDDVFEFGLIPMLESYSSKFGMIPKNIQWTALYHISWYFSRLINKNHNHAILNKEEETRFLTLLNTVFSFIDTKVILEFDLVGVWFFHKVGMLGAFKGEKPNSQIVYLESIDREKNQLLISYFSYFDVSTSFRIFNEDVIPCYEKTVHYSFANSLFVQEKRFWIPFDKDEGVLTVEIDEKPARISFQKKHHSSIGINSIVKGFKPSFKYYSNDSWMLMDRDTQADDNAEHLYRYIMNNHPDQQIYFALRKESHDWTRLEKEGFNLVEFNTENFKNKLRRSSKIISSHLDTYVTNYFGDDYEYSKKIIFLQHGVTKDDLSSWFNTKKNLHCIITATKPEYCSLVEDKGRYKLTEKEVVLTGFPRHDNLIKYNFQNNKIILIMPTWRQSIMGNVSGIGNTRTINASFMNTKYAQSWYHLIHSKKLARLVSDYDYKIIFAPHANIESYLKLFDVPDYIEIWQASKATSSMQEIFQKAKLMITDYSSVAFEMGILNKTTLYYQFDRDEVFSGGHIYQPGYFSYVKDGFGPVVTEENDLLIELEKVLNNNGEPLQPYATRMKNTFAYNDTKNCKRVYEAILNLDCSSTVETPVDKIMQYAQKAITHEAWDLALERIDKALNHSTVTTTQIENFIQMKEAVFKKGYECNPVKLANILWSSNRSKEALEKLQLDDKAELSEDILRLRVKLALLEDDFLTARDSQKLLLERYKQLCTIEDWHFYTQLITITSRLKN